MLGKGIVDAGVVEGAARGQQLLQTKTEGCARLDDLGILALFDLLDVDDGVGILGDERLWVCNRVSFSAGAMRELTSRGSRSLGNSLADGLLGLLDGLLFLDRNIGS